MVVGSIVFGGTAAIANLEETAVEHFVCKLGIRVDGVVVRLDSVCVVDGELGVVGSLDGFVDDAVDYTQRVEVHWVAGHAAILDLQVLLVKVAEERWAVVASVRLGEQIEFPRRTQRTKLGVKLGNGSQQSLEHMLHTMN